MESSQTSAQETPLLSERHGGVLLLRINRAERMNTWSEALEERYFALLDEAEADPEVGAVVITGEGRAFCAGADFENLQKSDDTERRKRVLNPPRPRHRPYFFRKPLVAAINGGTAGLGLVEALYCDVRFATPKAKLTTAFTRRGLIAEYGMSWILPRVVGAGRAADLLLSGRVFSGEEALAYGLVQFLAEPDELIERAIAYAADLAENCSPTSMAVVKDQLREDLGDDFAASFERTARLFKESLERPDVLEGVRSYLDRRPPEFAPLQAGSDE